MNALRLAAFAAALVAACFGAEERNAWPVRVAQTDSAGNVVSWQAAGPLVFKNNTPDGGAVSGFRPLFARWTDAAGAVRETDILYPLFVYRADGETYRWSVFNLINRAGPRPPGAYAATGQPEAFDVWPFWFSRDTGSPAESYRALLPVAGTIKHRFGYDELSWTIFPLYARAEKSGFTTTATPWPFVKVTRGTETGFALWPLYGTREKPGAFHKQFFLWPLGWDNVRSPAPDAAAGTPPRREIGFLPFYASETDAGLVNRSYLWPFFGYTDRTAAPAYHETRYFWPFLVQGRGDAKYVNRWGPFYTHSFVKGVDKRWVLWPFYREARWHDPTVAQRKTQFLYFLYWSQEQRSLRNPAAAPAAKTHLWPFVSAWDNGAGRRQVQFPSPLEIFLPDNERIRTSWSPLFSLYRYDQKAPDDTRTEILWGLVTWRRRPVGREFHLGPLFSANSQPRTDRIALARGLLSLQREPGAFRWRLRWLDFPGKADTLSASAR